MVLSSTLFTDGKAVTILSGTYKNIQHHLNKGYTTNTVTIWGGKFNGIDNTNGDNYLQPVVLYGGEYVNNPVVDGNRVKIAPGYKLVNRGSGTYPYAIVAE